MKAFAMGAVVSKEKMQPNALARNQYGSQLSLLKFQGGVGGITIFIELYNQAKNSGEIFLRKFFKYSQLSGKQLDNWCSGYHSTKNQGETQMSP